MTTTTSHEMTTKEGGGLDATASALVPYRLTKDEFELRLVPPIQRERRAAIRALEAALWAGDFAGTGYEKITQEHEMARTEDLFTPGIYIRTIHLPAGLRIVGKRHAQEHICIVSCGHATVLTEEGKQEIVGPCRFVSPAGTKRVIQVHETMVWTTVHRTNATNIEDAEADLIIAERLPELEAA